MPKTRRTIILRAADWRRHQEFDNDTGNKYHTMDLEATTPETQRTVKERRIGVQRRDPPGWPQTGEERCTESTPPLHAPGRPHGLFHHVNDSEGHQASMRENMNKHAYSGPRDSGCNSNSPTCLDGRMEPEVAELGTHRTENWCTKTSPAGLAADRRGAHHREQVLHRAPEPHHEPLITLILMNDQ